MGAGHPHTGKRVPFTVPDVETLALVLHTTPEELIRLARGFGGFADT